MTVTFPTGTDTTTFGILINSGDDLDEPTETFNIDLSAPAPLAAVANGGGSASVDITDSDGNRS